MTKTNLTNLLCYKLFNVVKVNEQLIDRAMEPFHLSRTQWKVMARFNFLALPCTQQQLLTSMSIDRAHLTRTLDQLEQRGLIVRERLASDKRAYNVFPTKDGIRLLKKIEQILQAESHSLARGLSQKEKSMLGKLLDRVASNILEELK